MSPTKQTPIWSKSKSASDAVAQEASPQDQKQYALLYEKVRARVCGMQRPRGMRQAGAGQAARWGAP